MKRWVHKDQHRPLHLFKSITFLYVGHLPGPMLFQIITKVSYKVLQPQQSTYTSPSTKKQ